MNALLDLIRRHCRDEVVAIAEELMHRQRPVRVRFAGIYYRDPTTGEIVMATQNVPLNTPSTAPLLFTDTNGASTPGPSTGTVTASDPAVTVALSASGQFVNVTLTGSVTATVTYTGIGANGVTLTATVDVTDQPVATTATAVTFGTFAPGTTA